MAVATPVIYSNGMKAVMNKQVDLDGNANLYAMFTSASHTPARTTHDYEDDLTNIVSGTNLPAAGIALSSATVTVSGNNVTFDLGDISVANVTASGIKNIHIVDKTSGAAATNPLICYAVLDEAISPAAGTLAVNFGASGVFTINLT